MSRHMPHDCPEEPDNRGTRCWFPSLYSALMLDSSGRATKKRYAINVEGHAHFFTFSCEGRRPLLMDDRIRTLVVRSLDRARRRHDLVLSAYVIMPEHVHVLLRPRSGAQIATILQAIKQPVSRRALQILGEPAGSRFWLHGGGFDRNIWTDEARGNAVSYIHLNPVRRGLVKESTEWRWSSAAFWAGETNVPLEMERGW